MDINSLIQQWSAILWGWPLLGSFLAVGILCTVFLYCVQIKYFFKSFSLVFNPSKDATKKDGGNLTPIQAFINALATATGNGSIAGIASAIYYGGPGAAFWMLIAGAVGMALRYAEVFLGTYFIGKHTFGAAKGGPMVYLSLLPGRRFMPYLFAGLLLLYGFSSGNAMQANAIGYSLANILNIDRFYIAIGLSLFVLYVVIGGADRVLGISDKLTPFKVIAFIVSAAAVLLFHANAILPSIMLMITSAFSMNAVAGSAVGIGIQQMIKSGTSRALNANEAGLGVAAVLFGASGTKKPIDDSIMSMLSVFISNFVVCFMVALCVIASGVWDSGLNGIDMTIAAYNTAFGIYGGWIVAFISASFGLGVLVAFIFIAGETWAFFTGGRYMNIFYGIYCLITFFGTQAKVDLIWNLNDLVNGSMLAINLYAILYFLPLIRRELRAYIRRGNKGA